MSNLVIVALPAEDDYIHKISSQKVPHMTLLFLGETDKVKNLSKILDFVEHAAERSLTRFGLDVDRRGELGEDKADVLFFSKSRWSGIEAVQVYRSYLLQNDNIRTAYDSVKDQFSEFIPHLTLGYPDNPAKPDKRDYPGTNYVTFDRIAVWVEEFDGPEFPLQRYEWDAEVAMSGSEIVDDILMHFGKKGMKWGVRKQVHSDLADIPKKTRKEAGKDAEEFTRAKLFFGEGAGIRRKLIKAKVEAKSVKDPLYAKAFDHFVKNTDLGQRASQAKSQRKRKDVTKALKRPAKSAVRIALNTLQQSDNQTSLMHSAEVVDEIVDDILMHFGKKGMKWGVRKERSSKVTVTDKGRKLKTSGGYGRKAHPDAVSARKLGQVGKKSGLKSLSNADLKAYSERLNLEQNVRRLNQNEQSKGRQFIGKLLGQNINKSANEATKVGTTYAVARWLKRGAKVAAVAAA